MMVQNAMAAAAAAHAAGAHLHDIRQGLRSFTTSIYQAPGRLNVFDLDGVKVLIDYAHNAAGLETLGDFVERMTSDAPSGEQPGAGVVDARTSASPSSRRRGTGATRTCASSGASPRATSTRSSSARIATRGAASGARRPS